MNYKETLDFLFNALPMYQRVGAPAFKKDLGNTIRLCERLGNPQTRFKSIHIAGTNGKGSTAHALASVLQESGYKTALYTSPHLKSFRERIKINGKEIPEKAVIHFVEDHKDFLEDLKPSFFEMTVALAFQHFAEQKVDYAVVEVGMGGRFDSTNVLVPELSVITSIGMDHIQFLGDRLEKIAFEKAGIIKQGVPVIIGQTHPETMPVFKEVAHCQKAPIIFADQHVKVMPGERVKKLALGSKMEYSLVWDGHKEKVLLDLLGSYQVQNLPAIWLAIQQLQKMGVAMDMRPMKKGLSNIVENTGLKGRWQILSDRPLVICDTGHNIDGVRAVVDQIKTMRYQQLYMVWGMVNDKDVDGVLALLPKKAHYIFCQAQLPRAMPADALKEKAKAFGIDGVAIDDVNEAIAYAKRKATPDDFIFVGGSTFVVAEINDL
ncbi:bifunctional folylpolyglutamate synthase/dihydrofolate synthase [Negadavirga shengliensis]|uniref:Dihydrofolate synthase/folylpolyglutamate synthase n=1 Tax=Negadavirga shengliensis TaxID=1389218 RepID=A0ABV9SZZ6_9BACT